MFLLDDIFRHEELPLKKIVEIGTSREAGQLDQGFDRILLIYMMMMIFIHST